MSATEPGIGGTSRRRLVAVGGLIVGLAALLFGASLDTSPTLPPDALALVRRAVTIDQEPFVLEDWSRPGMVGVADVPIEALRRMRSAIRPTLSEVYAGPLLEMRVRQFEALLEPGRDGSPFVIGFAVTNLQIDSVTRFAPGYVVAVTAHGSVTRPERRQPVKFGETLRLTLVPTDAGLRVVDVSWRCIPEFCP